ncbi:vacuolar sorting protein 39 domain 1-domain-containing protein [Gaertneriomyces semiglobifer]|nr:vacuolar sorting protein 39 domain 1-domain-containing protein [Gaertneriomyces semiglobifer]
MSRGEITPFKLLGFATELSLETISDTAPKNIVFGGRPTPLPTKATIEAIELCDTSLYIGTSDGHLLQYALQYTSVSDDKVLTGSLRTKKYLGIGRRKVHAIIAAPVEAKLAVLCDYAVKVYHAETLEAASESIAKPVFPVACFCADRHVQSPLPVTFAKRRVLACGHLGDGLRVEKEIPLPNGALMMVQHGPRICAADREHYKLINTATGEIVTLFPYDLNLQRPVAAVTEDGDYLVVTATHKGQGLGLFVSSTGEPIHGTLEWSAIPLSLAFQFPYVVALLANNTIEIHNVFGQELVQVLSLPEHFKAQFMREATFGMDVAGLGTIRIVIANAETLLTLCMQPLDAQIGALLDMHKVAKAVALAEQAMQHEDPDGDDSIKSAKLEALYQRAGFIYVRDTLFQEAFELFQKGRVDPRLILSLFPGISGYDRTSARDPTVEKWLEEFGTIDIIVRDSIIRDYPDADDETIQSFGEALVGNAKEMLERYLRYARTHDLGSNRLEEIDTALLKMYSDSSRKDIYQLLEGENHCNFEQSVAYLQKTQRFYALSLLYKSTGHEEEALDIWTSLVSNEKHDPDFPGIPLIVDYLALKDSRDLILKYSKWVLEKDPIIGVQLFTNSASSSFTDEEVFERLRPYGNVAIKSYLEYLINVQGKSEANLHTALAKLYISDVTDTSQEELARIHQEYHSQTPRPSFRSFLTPRVDVTSIAYRRLLVFLSESTHYDAADLEVVLTDKSELYAAKAILSMKGNKHIQALRILALELEDHRSVEMFCLAAGDRKTVLLIELFRIYLSSGREDLAVYAAHLLSTYTTEFNVREILDTIPDEWPLELLERFLMSTISGTIHERRQSQIVRALARGEHLKSHAHLIVETQSLPSIPIPLQGVTCVVCGKNLSDTRFSRLLSGDIVHVHCSGRREKGQAP